MQIAGIKLQHFPEILSVLHSLVIIMLKSLTLFAKHTNYQVKSLQYHIYNNLTMHR